ncbi:hypothetical protein DMENIID0001_162850 [Sergentomyia squamirostris]
MNNIGRNNIVSGLSDVPNQGTSNLQNLIIQEAFPSLPNARPQVGASQSVSYSNVVGGNSANVPKDNDGLTKLLILMQTNMNNLQTSVTEMIKKQNSMEECLRKLQTTVEQLHSSRND